MVYQIRAGYAVAGREIKVPQTFINGCIRAIIIAQTPDESQLLNVIHCAAVNAHPTEDDVSNVRDAVANWISTSYKGIVSDTVQFLALHVRGMDALVTARATADMTAVTGILTGDPLPYVTTLANQWTTGLTGPATRGMFFPFYAVEGVNDGAGRPTTGYAGQVITSLADLRGDLATAGYPLVVASFKYSLLRAVTGNGVNTLRWGTQVHRKPGRGR